MAPLSSHHIHGGHGVMMAVANKVDGMIDLRCFICCGLRLATGQKILCRALATRLYVCKKRRGPIDMNVAVVVLGESVTCNFHAIKIHRLRQNPFRCNERRYMERMCGKFVAQSITTRASYASTLQHPSRPPPPTPFD